MTIRLLAVAVAVLLVAGSISHADEFLPMPRLAAPMNCECSVGGPCVCTSYCYCSRPVPYYQPVFYDQWAAPVYQPWPYAYQPGPRFDVHVSASPFYRTRVLIGPSPPVMIRIR